MATQSEMEPPPPRASGRFGRWPLRLAKSGLILGLTSLALYQWRAPWRVERAESALQSGNVAEAARLSMDSLVRWPWDGRASRVAAVSLARLGDPALAVEWLKRADQYGTTTAADWVELAESQIRSGLEEETRPALARALELDPNQPVALERLSAVELSAKRNEAALELAHRLAKVPGKEEAAQELIGTIHVSAGVPDKAAEAMLEVARLDPDLMRLRLPVLHFCVDLVWACVRSGAPQRVVPVLEQVARNRLDLEPAARARIWSMLGGAQLQAGDIGGAVMAWEEADRLDPTYFDPPLQLGLIALKRRELDEAGAYLERAAKLAPEQSQVHYALASWHGMKGNRDAAAEELRRYEELRKLERPSPDGMGSRNTP